MAEPMMQDTAGKTIPAGYQQTEVGVIPNSWSIQRLANITTLIIDGTHHTPVYTSHGVPFLRVTDIQGEFDETRFKNISVFEHEQLIKRCHPQNGDLLLSKNGTIGIPRVVDWDWEFSVFVSLALIKLKRECLNVHYLEQFFRSDFLAAQLAQRSKQGTVTNLHLEEIREILVPLPPSLKEQTAIANVLSDSDALIDALEQMIAKKQAIKSATMQQLLTGRTRLPAFALRPDGTPKGYKPSGLGDIPEDWEVLSLGSFGRTIRGVSYNPNHDLFLYDSSESIRLFRSNNIFESKIEKSELQYVSKSRVADHQVIMVGDILICMANGSKSLVGKSAFYSIDDGYKYTFGAFMGVYRASDNVNRQYVHYLMNTEWYRRYIDLVLAGSSINNLKPSHVDQISFAFPDIKEQSAIATILSDMDNELQALTQKLDKARALKQGMMQQLLTGKIRLPLAAGA
ncbi:restriction endonuclease subunit S [Aeromonas veronii]|uniref:restriction endonuclease subunit S n=1 Tax=Aeromonas veronii TaxID=654 RepID=UPI003BA336C2